MVVGNRGDEEMLMTPAPGACEVMQTHDSGGGYAMDLEITLRDSPGSESGVGLASLERDVLAISATGRGVAEVAALLSQSPDKVREALGHAIIKLGARSKLEAVLIAMRASLIALPEHPSGGNGGVTSRGANDDGIE
jgi:DNA-binding CsgD family transcriptional regulator